MESIGTAETAEAAEIALTRLSGNSAVSAVQPVSGPTIHWKKSPEIFHRKIANSSPPWSRIPDCRTQGPS